MATIVRSGLQRRIPTTFSFSRPVLFATLSRYPSHPGQPGRLPSFRWSARTLSNSAALHEKYYTTDHEWVELSGDGKTATIGISTYAAKALGDVVYIELPTLDTDIKAGDTIGAVESVKSASDVLSPISGKVTATNDALEVKPGLINEAPEGDGWIAEIEVGEKNFDDLMNGDEYQKFTEE